MNYGAALGQVPGLMQNYGGPVGVVGRAIGLGQAELEAGIPWWGWLGVGVVVGGVLTYAARDKIQQIVEA